MTRSLSQDLRSRVIAVVDGGLSCNAAAERFGIAVSSAVRWVRAWRSEGRVDGHAEGGDLRSHRIEAFATSSWLTIEAEVDITLVELAEMLERQHGARLRPARSGASSTGEDSPSKKTAHASEQAAAGRGPQEAGLVRRAA